MLLNPYIFSCRVNTIRSIAFFFEFFELIVAEQPAGGFDESGIHGNALVDGQSFGFELAQDFGVLPC